MGVRDSEGLVDFVGVSSRIAECFSTIESEGVEVPLERPVQPVRWVDPPARPALLVTLVPPVRSRQVPLVRLVWAIQVLLVRLVP